MFGVTVLQHGASSKEGQKTRVPSPAKATRFPAPTGSPTMSDNCKGYVPQKKRKKATTWALHVFNAWRQERNRVATEKCPDDLLERRDVGNLNRFVVECRREDGKPYPPPSISNILTGLYRHSKRCVRVSDVGSCPNFMNRKDPDFSDVTGAIQVRFRELREKGVGAHVSHAPGVLPNEEDMLWASKVIGDHTPLAL